MNIDPLLSAGAAAALAVAAGAGALWWRRRGPVQAAAAPVAVSGVDALTGLPTLANVVAQSPVRLRVIPHDAFEALMARYPAILRELMRIQSLRFSALHYLSLERETLNLKERLLKTLHALALSQPGDTEQGVSIHMPQIELSRMLAVSRPKLNQALKELEKEGLLSVHYGSICLHRPADPPTAYHHQLASSQPAAAPLRTARARPQRMLS
jgi:hypothetical protein